MIALMPLQIGSRSTRAIFRPLEPPQGFKGEIAARRQIRLSWDPVEEAVGYQLYRQAPNESELTDYQRIDIGLEYFDKPSVEGLYTYAVASIRSENGQEAVSGLSNSVQVMSDSTAPDAPINLSLELVSNGIEAEWEPPPYTEPVTYSLYRADFPEIVSVDGLMPLVTGIEQTFAIDPNPSPSEHAYVVTAVDGAGNESAPSNSFYLNFELLPVSSLQVVQTDNDPPQVSWTHPGRKHCRDTTFTLATKTTGSSLIPIVSPPCLTRIPAIREDEREIHSDCRG